MHLLYEMDCCCLLIVVAEWGEKAGGGDRNVKNFHVFWSVAAAADGLVARLTSNFSDFSPPPQSSFLSTLGVKYHCTLERAKGWRAARKKYPGRGGEKIWLCALLCRVQGWKKKKCGGSTRPAEKKSKKMIAGIFEDGSWGITKARCRRLLRTLCWLNPVRKTLHDHTAVCNSPLFPGLFVSSRSSLLFIALGGKDRGKGLGAWPRYFLKNCINRMASCDICHLELHLHLSLYNRANLLNFGWKIQHCTTNHVFANIPYSHSLNQMKRRELVGLLEGEDVTQFLFSPLSLGGNLRPGDFPFRGFDINGRDWLAWRLAKRSVLCGRLFCCFVCRERLKLGSRKYGANAEEMGKSNKRR